MDKQKIMIIGMIIALFLMGQYIILEEFQNEKKQEIIDAQQISYKQGVKEVLVTLYEQTENCHISTIVTGNLTKQVTDVRCLKSEKSNP